MKEIKLKVYSKYFEKILSREKKFELRLGDKQIEKGDILILMEIGEDRNFTGRELRKEVNYVVNTKDLNYWKKEDVDKFGFTIALFD